MYTIKSTAPGGTTLGHYGTFDNMPNALRAVGNVRRIASAKYASSNVYTVVLTPDGVTPLPLHPAYVDSVL